MVEQDAILASIYAVVNMTISVLIGFILSKLGVLTPTTRKVVSDMNYYVFVPMFGLFFVMQAVDRNRLGEIGMLILSTLPCVGIGLAVSLIIALFMKLDVRIRFSYIFVNIYGNFIVIPQMLAATLCEKGGKYSQTSACKANLVNAYASVSLLYINSAYWTTVLPILQDEKRMSIEIKKIFAVVLNFYETVDDFLKDTKCAKAKLVYRHPNPPPCSKVTGIIAPMMYINPPKSPATMLDLTASACNLYEDSTTPPDLLKIEDPFFVEQYYQRFISKADYHQIKEVYEEFEELVFNKPENMQLKQQINREILTPAGLIETPKEENVCTFDFFKRRILLSPPTMCSLLGLVLGFIFPFKEWLYDPLNKPLPTFIHTVQTIGSIMSPMSLFLLGTYLAQSSTITANMFIRWKHVILSLIMKNAITPIVGLFWVLVVIRSISGEAFKTNPILIFIDYSQWIVPNGIVLIAVYVVADYFAREFAVLSIYMNLVSIPMMAVFMSIYFTLYDRIVS